MLPRPKKKLFINRPNPNKTPPKVYKFQKKPKKN